MLTLLGGIALGIILVAATVGGGIAFLAWAHRPEHCDWPGAGR